MQVRKNDLVHVLRCEHCGATIDLTKEEGRMLWKSTEEFRRTFKTLELAVPEEKYRTIAVNPKELIKGEDNIK